MSIIAVDLDGTLCLGDSFPDPNKGKVNVRLIQYLTLAREQGHKLILNTMREGELLDAAVDWCMERGLAFDAINDNLPEMIEKWGCNPRKVYADYVIDDHNANCGIGKRLPRLKINRKPRKEIHS